MGEITVKFQPVLPQELEELSLNQVEATMKNENGENEETPLPAFGPHADNNKHYKFEDEVAQLPLKVNLCDAPFMKQQQDWLLDIIYDHQKVFSVHNEDLGFCNRLTHRIPTMTDKPVYTVTGQYHGNYRVR